MLNDHDRRFLTEAFPRIEGWCVDDVAWITAGLLDQQLEAGRNAPLFEIGVYKGKYFSVLARHAQKAGTRAWGFDTFAWAPQQEVHTNLHNALGHEAPYRLVKGDSAQMSADQLEDWLGAKASFASVDGDHNAGPVQHDLRLAHATLAPWGIIALDDFYNPLAIGVTEGLFRFILQDRHDLAPFAHCKNKLLLARADYVDEYSRRFLDACEAHRALPGIAAWFDVWAKQGDSWVKQQLLGRPVWVMP